MVILLICLPSLGFKDFEEAVDFSSVTDDVRSCPAADVPRYHLARRLTGTTRSSACGAVGRWKQRRPVIIRSRASCSRTFRATAIRVLSSSSSSSSLVLRTDQAMPNNIFRNELSSVDYLPSRTRPFPTRMVSSKTRKLQRKN